MVNETDSRKVEQIELIILRELARFPQRGKSADALFNATTQLHYEKYRASMYLGDYNAAVADLEKSKEIKLEEGIYKYTPLK